MRLLKLENKRKGWTGEECWRQRGRRFIKRLEHRHNRHYGRKLCREEQP